MAVGWAAWWSRSADSLRAAKHLLAEAAGNKELRSSWSCPGKKPPLFALIILLFSILHRHNDVSGPVLTHWITRYQLRSGTQMFPEPDLASVPSCELLEEVAPFLFPLLCAHVGLGLLSTNPKPSCSYLAVPWLFLHVQGLLLGAFPFPCGQINKADISVAPQEFSGSVKPPLRLAASSPSGLLGNGGEEKNIVLKSHVPRLQLGAEARLLTLLCSPSAPLNPTQDTDQLEAADFLVMGSCMYSKCC